MGPLWAEIGLRWTWLVLEAWVQGPHLLEVDQIPWVGPWEGPLVDPWVDLLGLENHWTWGEVLRVWVDPRVRVQMLKQEAQVLFVDR